VEIDFNKSGETAVVAVKGRLDTISAPELEERLLRWIEDGEGRIVIDLEGLEYISSAGLRVLLSAGKKVAVKGGKLSCCGLKGVVRKVFDVSGFSRLLPVFETVEDASKG
jgi:anti-anti-sigma factor